MNRNAKFCRTAILVASAIAVSLGGVGAQAQQAVMKVAYVGPLTGPNTAMGIGTRNSLDLALRQANASGKLPFKLELISETDDSKPSTGVAAVQKICSDPSVIAASAHWNSPVALATMSYFQGCGLLNLIAGASVDALTQKGVQEIGRVATPLSALLPHLAARLSGQLKAKTVAIVKSRDAFGDAGTDGFVSEFEKRGGKVIAIEGYNVGDRDFTASLTKIRQLKPDAVYLSGLTTEAALVARQMRQIGMNQLYVGHGGWQTSTFIEASGIAGQGAIVVTSLPEVPDLPGGAAYAKSYAAAGYKEPHEAYGPFGFAAGEVIVALLRIHGPDRKAIVAGLRQLKNLDTIFGKVSFDAQGEMQPKYVDMAIVKGSTWEKLGR